MKSKRIYRNANSKYIAGVASGIANYVAIDPVLMRIAFIMSAFFGGFGILVYIICWIIIPETDEPIYATERIYRNMNHKKIGGVAAGFEDFFNIDVNIIRVAFAFSAFWGGFGLLLYVFCWIVIPPRSFYDRIDNTKFEI